MRRSCSVIALAAALLSAIPAVAADWPAFRGPGRDGFSPETGINKDWKAKPPAVLWKVPLGDDGYAGPSAADGKVFIIDHQGNQDIVMALDLKTGQKVWDFTYEDAGNSNYGFSRSTPVFDGGKLFTLSRLGKLHCLDAKSGQKIWMRDLVVEFKGKRPGWDMAMSPVIDGDRLIVMPSGPDAEVAALDKDTGKTIWAGGGSDTVSYATPVVATIAGKKQYIIFDCKGAGGVDAQSGQRLWSFPWKTSYDVNAAMPLVIDDSVFITSDYGRGCALVKVAGDQPEKVWESKEIHSHFSSPILYPGNGSGLQGCIYGTTDPGFLVCLDPKTGKSNWRQKGFEKGGLIAADGTMIVLDGANGDLVMVKLDPTAYTELGRIKPLGGQSWTAPVLADGKLIVRNKQALACLDLK